MALQSERPNNARLQPLCMLREHALSRRGPACNGHGEIAVDTWVACRHSQRAASGSVTMTVVLTCGRRAGGHVTLLAVDVLIRDGCMDGWMAGCLWRGSERCRRVVAVMVGRQCVGNSCVPTGLSASGCRHARTPISKALASNAPLRRRNRPTRPLAVAMRDPKTICARRRVHTGPGHCCALSARLPRFPPSHPVAGYLRLGRLGPPSLHRPHPPSLLAFDCQRSRADGRLVYPPNPDSLPRIRRRRDRPKTLAD